jgi:hypothetical protein
MRYETGRPDGQLGRRTQAAADLYRQIATRELPPLSRETASEWCAVLSKTDLDNAIADGWTKLTGEEIRSLYFGATH